MIADSPIEKYEPHPQAWIICCYYNPLKFASRRRNLEIFRRQLEKSNVSFLIVECAFGRDSFELPLSVLNVVRYRGRDVLWQKERLLNLAEKLLPPRARYIIWLDADVLFTNPLWIKETVAVLENSVVCQPFSRCVRLLPEQFSPDERNLEIWQSFASVFRENQENAASDNFNLHGHTGFAWAARREIFEKIGLYDRAIAGTADHLMAHAGTGAVRHPCIERAFFSAEIRAHFERWGERFYKAVQGKIGYVKGDLLHLWHGELKNRRYLERTRELSQLGFDPLSDLTTNDEGLLEFAAHRDDLRGWMLSYFRQRLEDECALETAATADIQNKKYANGI